SSPAQLPSARVSRAKPGRWTRASRSRAERRMPTAPGYRPSPRPIPIPPRRGRGDQPGWEPPNPPVPGGQKPGAPPRNDSQPENYDFRHEEGGWLIRNDATGESRLKRVPAGVRAGIQPGPQPELGPGEHIEGFAHTHPNPAAREPGRPLIFMCTFPGQ